jgi:hypothetical protein
MWFCVSALSISEHNPPVPPEQRVWEEHLFLLKANDAAHAKSRAEELARRLECSFEAANKSKVTWKFKRISKVHQLEGEPTDGAEVFSRFLKDSEARSLESPIE